MTSVSQQIVEILLRAGMAPVPGAVVVEIEQLVRSAWTPEALRQQLRLKCAEIIWTTGSQAHRDQLELHAERLYKFSIDIPKSPA